MVLFKVSLLELVLKLINVGLNSLLFKLSSKLSLLLEQAF
jgi:hypothetical protein